jgi:hypothetical protein
LPAPGPCRHSCGLSPPTGRWVSLDPLRYDAGDVNLYRTVFNAPTVFTDPSGQLLFFLAIAGVAIALGGIGGLHYSASRYDYAREHYLSRPIQQWTPEVQAEYRDYVRTTDWIAAGSEVAGWTGVSMVATPYMAYGSGYLWSAGGTGGRIFVGSVGVGGVGSTVSEGYAIYHDWDTMDGPEQFRRVGNLAGPTLTGALAGPRYFHLGRRAGDLRMPFGSAPASSGPAYRTWNQFQTGTAGQFSSRAEAAAAWNAYRQANGIVTGTVRSQAARSQYLRSLADHPNTPSWMRHWLREGRLPPGYEVDHITPLSIGGADTPANMRLQAIDLHRLHHQFYRPWE